MGDRCFMQVTCRRQDQARFADLGFRLEFEQERGCPVIEMIDEEANYAHSGRMPTDIPYRAEHGSGSNYGEGHIVCDGSRYAEAGGTSDGFVVSWDFRRNKPTPRSLAHIRRFIVIERKAKRLLHALRTAGEAGLRKGGHCFSPQTHQCVHCGRHADEDAVEHQPCTP
jgi:hypothetical protein